MFFGSILIKKLAALQKVFIAIIYTSFEKKFKLHTTNILPKKESQIYFK
jgi:hypothetical protein